MSLPMMTSSHDVMDIVNFLASKPNGTTLTDAMTSLPRSLMEDRKLNAFLYWGVIRIQGDRIELDSLGKDLNMIAPENRYLVYQKLIHTTKLYKLAVDWMFQKGFNEVTNIEVASFWHMKYKSEIGSSDENIMKSMATCFLQICEAANFGSTSPGKMSKTTHFKIDRTHLGRYFTDTSQIFDRELKSTGAVPAVDTVVKSRMEAGGTVRQAVSEFDLGPPGSTARPEPEPPRPAAARPGKQVFISPSRNRDLVEQIRGMMEMEKVNYNMSSTDEISSILELVKISSAMQSCSAGVIFVTSEESLPGEGGRFKMSPNKLVEIGAALAVFGGRVVLIWDDRVEVPPVLHGLEIISYTGKELTWNAGSAMMNAIKRFNNA